MKNKNDFSAALLLAILFLSACAGSDNSGQEDENRLLRDQLQTARTSLSQEKLKALELQKQQSRILDCHRDFRGSYGKLIESSIHLKRVTGRVIRKDCEGQTLSDKIETIVPPVSRIELKELKELQGLQVEFRTLNRQTCGGGGFSMGMPWSKFPSLLVDRANALFTHEVFAGLNQIDFGACDPKGSTPGISKDCQQPTWLASLYLQVSEEEVQSPDITEFKPSETVCSSKNAPKP